MRVIRGWPRAARGSTTTRRSNLSTDSSLSYSCGAMCRGRGQSGARENVAGGGGSGGGTCVEKRSWTLYNSVYVLSSHCPPINEYTSLQSRVFVFCVCVFGGIFMRAGYLLTNRHSSIKCSSGVPCSPCSPFGHMSQFVGLFLDF